MTSLRRLLMKRSRQVSFLAKCRIVAGMISVHSSLLLITWAHLGDGRFPAGEVVIPDNRRPQGSVEQLSKSPSSL